MDQVKTIIQTYLVSNSIKATARQLKISKNTVRSYVRRAKDCGEDLSKLLELEDEVFHRIFYEGPTAINSREDLFSQKVEYWIKELRRTGVTRYLLWEEYRREYPDGYGYSQFCERLKREKGRGDLSLALDHNPGEVMMLDFAGKKLRWVDLGTAEVHECEILIAVFPYSQYTFALGLASQKIEDFIHGLNQAFLFFGALPKVILSDNLKAYVNKPDRYEPTFTQLCEQLAAHYQVDLQATRVGKPKDKASVENAVAQTYRRIYAPLRNELFHSLEQLNEVISTQLGQHNAKPYQKKQGCRKSVFQDDELPQMRELPSELFEIKKITTAKIQNNYHVFLGEEKNYYSVPFQYCGQRAEVLYTSKIVEIYLKGRRIAIHQRLPGRDTYLYQTKAEHMPRNHQEWKQAQGYDGEYFLNQARKIGPATHWAIQHILCSRIYQEQSYKSCLGTLKLADKYSAERLENAAKRCEIVQKTSYRMLKRILQLNLDKQAAQAKQMSLPFHDNIRGPQHYQ